MTDPTYKITKLVGVAEGSIEDAVRAALATSAGKVRKQSWCQITDLRAALREDGTVQRWQAEVEVAFEVEG